MTFIAVFLLIAAILFALATLGVPSPPRFGLMAGGLFFWVLAEIIGRGILH